MELPNGVDGYNPFGSKKNPKPNRSHIKSYTFAKNFNTIRRAALREMRGSQNCPLASRITKHFLKSNMTDECVVNSKLLKTTWRSMPCAIIFPNNLLSSFRYEKVKEIYPNISLKLSEIAFFSKKIPKPNRSQIKSYTFAKNFNTIRGAALRERQTCSLASLITKHFILIRQMSGLSTANYS